MITQKRYILDLTIEGLPATYNATAMKSHWFKIRNKNLWKDLISHHVRGLEPKQGPLAKARCSLTRCSSKAPDYDGLVQSFKPVLDGLVQSGILIDDAMSVIGKPEYQWEPAKRGQGSIKISVEEL